MLRERLAGFAISARDLARNFAHPAAIRHEWRNRRVEIEQGDAAEG
jgi:hypothetical protein